MEDYKRIAVIGLGEFGSLLVRRLFEGGHEVLAIDRDMERVEALASFSTSAVCLDSTDRTAMEAQELEDLDKIIIALTDFENLITTADVLRSMKITGVMARYQNGLEYKILRMLGVSDLFNPGDKAARNMVEQFSNPGFHDRIVLDGEFTIVETPAPEALVGQELNACGLRHKYHLNIVTIKRDTEDQTSQEILGVPYGDTVIEKHDTLVLFGKADDIKIFLEDQQS
ncbi:MAG: TrkA family potassium uptake protein [bacterium]|nr:TrkA family potassium uptake protein [bacterium]